MLASQAHDMFLRPTWRRNAEVARTPDRPGVGRNWAKRRVRLAKPLAAIIVDIFESKTNNRNNSSLSSQTTEGAAPRAVLGVTLGKEGHGDRGGSIGDRAAT